MRARLFSWSVVVFLATAWLGPRAPAAESAGGKSSADEQVRRVLLRESAGELASREQALAETLAEAPLLAAARWQSGYVRWRGQWLKFDEVTKLADYQELLRQYAAARGRAPATVRGQLELADWCRARELEPQEKIHLGRVLELDPDHSGARARLGFVNLGGNWYDKQELAAAEKRGQEANKALARWSPQIKQILAGLGRSNVREQAAAEQKLKAIRDPAALPAIEAHFSAAPSKHKLKAVETIAAMTSPEAAVSLAKFALNNPFDEVGLAAAEALQARPADSYVPPLLSLLSTPIDTRFALFQRGNQLVYRQMFFREADDRRELFGLSHTVLVGGGTPALQSQALALQAAGVRAEAADQNARLAERNAEIEKLNKRVCDVLSLATGEKLPPSAESWWQWWNDKNEVFLPDGKPLQSAAQVTANVVNLGSVEAAPISFDAGGAVQTMPAGRRCECLVAGTPVWTASGPVAVEKIAPGDLVLSQNIETGELAYKAVLTPTVRPAGPVLRIELADETIRSSGGHPFWVVGQGWVLARNLKSGQKLRDARGATEIKSVVDEPDAKETTYNLIVSDFGNYFVGAAQVLSHDNTIRRPTSALVPGLLPE